MSYQVFARKYRPRTFDELLGQEHVVRTLRNAIAQDRIGQAYLFVGPRGTGKTSTARILAKALNCPGGPSADFDPDDPVCEEIAEGRNLDVLEIDGASNNSVDQIRELRETVRYAPTTGQFKIYYIDEVHMLSAAAFNALLKTLEEPPPHVKFIFATTEANKILPTIISRCQRFDLRKIPAPLIARHLLKIAELEGVNLSESAALAVAQGADGGMRDAQSMLDQLVAFCGSEIEESDVQGVFGFTSFHTVARIMSAVLGRHRAEALLAIGRLAGEGKDLNHLLHELLVYLRHLLVAQISPAQVEAEIPPEEWEAFEAQVNTHTPEKLIRIIDILAAADGRMKWASNKRLHLEIALLQAIESLDEVSTSDVVAYLHKHLPDLELLPAERVASEPAPVERPVPTPPKVEKHSPPAPEEVRSEPPAPEKKSVAVEPPATVSPPEKAPERAEKIVAPEPPAPQPVRENSAPAPQKAPAGNLEARWDRVREEARSQGPLFAEQVAVSHALSLEEGQLRVGFHPEDDFFRKRLSGSDARALLAEVVESVFGFPVSIKLVSEPSLPRREVPAYEPPAVPEPEPEPSKQDAQASEATAPEEESAAPDLENESDFYNDPLIKEALRLFENQIAAEAEPPKS